jgi:N-acetyl-alpha-D-muramate 1-phosphate uridylyltransferase
MAIPVLKPKCKAIILAAGRGVRMRPLTDSCPKPLLTVAGTSLLEWHLQSLSQAGLSSVIINTGWLGDQIERRLGRRDSSGAIEISYSHEDRDFGHALETAGGIARAMPQLSSGSNDIFWVVAGDAFMPEFSFNTPSLARFAAGHALAHIWLVPNPSHHLSGDFCLDQGLAIDPLSGNTAPRYTYACVGLYRPSLFCAPWCALDPGNANGTSLPLAPVLRAAMHAGLVSAELYTGPWFDVGTPERLTQINAWAKEYKKA